MAGLQVEIVTPEGRVFSGQALEAQVPGWEGELGVLPEHDALLSLLKCGVATVRTDTGTRSWVIGRGFADIGSDHVTVLTDQAEDVAKVDKEAARALLESANAELASGTLSNAAAQQAAVRAEWAQAVLDA